MVRGAEVPTSCRVRSSQPDHGGDRVTRVVADSGNPPSGATRWLLESALRTSGRVAGGSAADKFLRSGSGPVRRTARRAVPVRVWGGLLDGQVGQEAVEPGGEPPVRLAQE